MKVLVACECSGVVRDVFRARGHDAWSCDIKPCERDNSRHIQDDVSGVLRRGWHLVIAHPPCTDLSVSCSRLWKQKQADGRQRVAVDFFMLFTRLPCRWAIENPVGYMSTHYRKPDQIIQPWQYGHDASKKTCLWLSELPLLKQTTIVPPRMVNGLPRWDNQTDSGQNKLPPSENRATERSRTYHGIADAMAEQWGGK